MKSLDDLAIFYQETTDENTFLEIRKRLRPLITKRAKGAIRERVSPDDIEQAAALAIAIALLRYDPKKGGFAAYAVPFVIGQLDRKMAMTRTTTYNPSSRERTVRNQAGAFIAKEQANGDTHRQAVEAAADRFGVSVDEVEKGVRSLLSAGEFHDADDAGQWSDVAPREQRDIIEDAMSGLSDVERIVVSERHLRANPASVYETAEKAGMTFQSVSRVGKRALAKMRARLEARGLNADDVLA